MTDDATSWRRCLDSASDHMRRTGRDYLLEDRLVRRFRIGDWLYAGQLRGYQATYEVSVRMGAAGPTPQCTCGRIKQPCAHSAALLLDLDAHPSHYGELGWRGVHEAERRRETAPLSLSLDWSTIAQTPPWWRTASPTAAELTLAPMVEDTCRSLERDPLIGIWAEMPSSLMQVPTIVSLFEKWLSRYLPSLPQDSHYWAALHWMQPGLPLTPVFLQLHGRNEAKSAILRRLYDRSPWIAARPDREDALRRDLSLVEPELGHQVWRLGDRRDVLGHADALYAAGRSDLATTVLETDLPNAVEDRRQARLRLVQWVDIKASIPHRVALAWETGSLEWIAPVRGLFEAGEWDRLVTALKSRGGELLGNDPS